MARIALRDVTKSYAQTVVVNDISLEIADGEFVVLVGPSGCGKSTTLRMIAGLDSATSGEIAVGDRVVNEVPAKDRNIAMVFQSYALYPHMTVYDNMAFGLRMRNVARTEERRLIDDAAKILGLGPLLTRKPRDLSGGQRQRVALGRAIVREPAAFLMDEPLSNLDAKLRVQMRADISRLHQRLRSTVVYVTHDQIEAMTMGDRIVVMSEGNVQQVGPPLEIYERPANMFVAGFIGSPAMNFIDVDLHDVDGNLFARAPQVDIEVAPGQRAALSAATGRGITLGVRPENMTLARNGSAAPSGIQARVDVIEVLGAEKLVLLATGETTLTARVSADVPVAVGDTVHAQLNPAKLHFFDRTSGNAFRRDAT